MSFPILPTPVIHSPLFQGKKNKEKSQTASVSITTPQDSSPSDTYVGQRSNSEPQNHTQGREGSVSSKGTPNLQTSLGAALSTARAPASPNGSVLTVPSSPDIRNARRRSITELATDAAVSLLPPMPFKKNVRQTIRISRQVKQETALPDDPSDINRKEYKIPKSTRKDRKVVQQYYEEQIDGVLSKTGGLNLNDEAISTFVDQSAVTEEVAPFTTRRIDGRKRTGSNLSEFERDIEHEYALQQAGRLRTQQNQQEEEELKAKRKS